MNNENESDSRMMIRAANTARIVKYMMPYFTTIQRRVRFCLMENKGARICFDGRSQTERFESQYRSYWPEHMLREHLQSRVAWSRSTYGIMSGKVRMNKRKWPMRRSELQRETSIAFTTNSRAG
jgi:hypothetical protein